MAVTAVDAALDVLDRAENICKLDTSTPNHATTSDVDLRRLSLAMGVAALDTYMHWRLRRMDLGALSKSAGSKLKLPLHEFVHLGDRSVQARRSVKAHRPQTTIRRALNDQLLTETFQSAHQWDRGFGYLGVKSGLSRTASAMSPSETHQAVAMRLNQLSHRRNLIVHEGDHRRLMRPRQISRERITRQYVDDALAWIRRFLIAADTV